MLWHACGFVVIEVETRLKYVLHDLTPIRFHCPLARICADSGPRIAICAATLVSPGPHREDRVDPVFPLS
jgi:hypothetical protein